MTRTSPTRTRTRRTPASDAALLRATEPVGADEFLAEYWERKPLHVTRDDPTRFDDLLSARDVERVVSEPGLRFPGFRLVKAGAKLEPAEYTEDLSWRPVPFSGTARVPKVLEEFDGGATVVLQGLHLNWTPLAHYCRVLEARLGHPAQANAYFTPRHSQGLPVHHDTHDVFVLQVSGSKRWLVYEPALELPLKHQRYRPAQGEPGEVVLDVQLRAGDTLYLPRGWLHEALTSDDDSLHVTVGLNVYPWIDAVRAAVDRCAQDVEFRRSAGGEGTGLLERLEEELDPEAVAGEARRRFVRTRRPILDGQLRQLRALEDLSPDTVLERRETVIADLETTERGTVLLFEGKRLVFPARIEPDVAFVVETQSPFRAGDLPGSLDDGGRLVLISRLVREGFLRIVL